ncbi:hypothetical protein LCGC14_0978820 [marine sediment metagenome]|uniref:Uncharacterized protein n=1 Tax=marine sediment metagenome TaxID=412755 RepID=A0A0F9N9D6_9ZZZZ
MARKTRAARSLTGKRILKNIKIQARSIPRLVFTKKFTGAQQKFLRTAPDSPKFVKRAKAAGFK